MMAPVTEIRKQNPAREVPARVRVLAAVLLLLLMALLFFPGAFSGGAFYYRDLFRVHHPAKTIGLDSLNSEGRLPWWSHNHSLGQPFLADPNFTVFYPTNLLYLVLPFNTAFNLHVVLHVFLCGLFTLPFLAWLTYLELFVIEAICIWCVTYAVLVIAGWVVATYVLWRGQGGTP